MKTSRARNSTRSTRRVARARQDYRTIGRGRSNCRCRQIDWLLSRAPAAGERVTLSLDGLPPLREVIEQHGLHARKALGQNFLLDLNLTGKIARAAGDLVGCHRHRSRSRPRRAYPRSANRMARSGSLRSSATNVALPRWPRSALTIRGGWKWFRRMRSRSTWLNSAKGEADQDHRQPALQCRHRTADPVAGDALEWPPFYRSLTLMFQKEVAERIVARPGDDAYGRLGVLAGWRTDAQITFDVPARAFTPPPKVTSSVVHIIPRPSPLPPTFASWSASPRLPLASAARCCGKASKALAVNRC